MDEIEKYLRNRNIAEADIITDHLPLLKQGRGTVYVEKRFKTAQSLYEKIKIRGKREGIIDTVGVRFIHLCTNQLPLIADLLISNVKTEIHNIKSFSERGRIIHLVFYPMAFTTVYPTATDTATKATKATKAAKATANAFSKTHPSAADEAASVASADASAAYLTAFKPIEVQLWPIALHTCFESEHDTVYKAKTILTQEQVTESEILRKKEHDLQSLIDAEASSLGFLK